MAPCITNSLLRTKSFQIRSPLPPLISLPTTTIRTVFKIKSIDPEKSEKAQHEEYPYEIDYKSRGTTKEKSNSWWHRIKHSKFVSKANFLLRPRIDPGQLRSMIQNLKASPPNVFVEHACKLEDRLGEAAMGNAFLLQAGDSIDGTSKEFNDDTFKVILQMSTILMFRAQMPIIKVGNQISKPRSQAFEEKDGSVKLDYLNGDAFDPKLSTSHPQRLIKPYRPQWNLDFMENSEYGDRYREPASQVEESLRIMLATGHTVDHPTDVWTSHEYLPNDKRPLITRKDSTSSLSYDCSSHFLWVDEQTCQLDGPHVEFLRGIANPLGIKVSDKMDPKKLVKLIGILNPENKPGRITIITRMGAENIKLKLPNIVREVKRGDQIVTWVTDPDPMPRNTIKPHRFDAIRAEVRAFFDVHEQEGSYPGGVHLEMTGQNKTKVNGGSRTTTFDNTHSNPSLNASQALELAFIIAERLQKQRITTRPTN